MVTRLRSWLMWLLIRSPNPEQKHEIATADDFEDVSDFALQQPAHFLRYLRRLASGEQPSSRMELARAASAANEINNDPAIAKVLLALFDRTSERVVKEGALNGLAGHRECPDVASKLRTIAQSSNDPVLRSTAASIIDAWGECP